MSIITAIIKVIMSIITFIFGGIFNPLTEVDFNQLADQYQTECSVARTDIEAVSHRVYKVKSNVLCNANVDFDTEYFYGKIKTSTLQNADVEIYRPYYKGGSYGFNAELSINRVENEQIPGYQRVQVREGEFVKSVFHQDQSMANNALRSSTSEVSVYAVNAGTVFSSTSEMVVRVPALLPDNKFLNELAKSMRKDLIKNSKNFVGSLLSDY